MKLRLHPRGTSAAARDDERGAVIVEMALVAIFLLTLFAGTYDFGQAWRTGLAVNEAARTGARVGSAQGPLREADYNALSGVRSALQSSGELQNVVRVVVFKATSATGDVPVLCKTASTSECQVIDGAAFKSNWVAQPASSATAANGCLNIASAQNWCPTSRNNVQATAEYYGIWVRVQHDYEFPILGSGTTVDRTTVMRLEPKVQ